MKVFENYNDMLPEVKAIFELYYSVMAFDVGALVFVHIV